MQVTIRDFKKEDIPMVLDYWYSSDPSFVESMGVDLSKFPERDEFERSYISMCEKHMTSKDSKISTLTICVDGKAVGYHAINQMVLGDHGVFHAHICDENMRRKGIGIQSYPLACHVFMKRFDLKKIVFKTPINNTGAIRLKEKLKIPFIGEGEISFGIVKDGTKVKIFEYTRPSNI